MCNFQFVNRRENSAMGKNNRHYEEGKLFKVFVTILIVILFIFVSLFLIYLVSILKQTDTPQTYFEMLGVISGFAGAFFGSIITLVAVYATLQSSKNQLRETLKANEKQTEASVNASRELMLEERRIENLPYFHVYPYVNTPSIDGSIRVTTKLTEKTSDNTYTLFLIKNISKAYALNAIVGIFNKKNEFLEEQGESDILIMPPESVHSLTLYLEYDKNEMIEKIKVDGHYYKFLILRICYDSVNDMTKSLFATADNYKSERWKANFQDVYINVNAEESQGELKFSYHVTTRMEILLVPE